MKDNRTALEVVSEYMSRGSILGDGYGAALSRLIDRTAADAAAKVMAKDPAGEHLAEEFLALSELLMHISAAVINLEHLQSIGAVVTMPGGAGGTGGDMN